MEQKVYALHLAVLSLVATAYPIIDIVERQYRAQTYDARFSFITIIFFPLIFGICLSLKNRSHEHQLVNIAFFIVNFVVAAVMWGKLYYISTYNLIILGLLFLIAFTNKKGEGK